MMRHLFWKDANAVRPLLLAILIGIVALFLICLVFSAWLGTSEITTVYASFWILMPNLVALGAPAILIGTEEENGTLSWLRTLPVPWTSIAHSKFLASLGSVLIAWTVSSIAMILARTTFAVGSTPMVQDWTSPAGITYLLTFSLLLLLCGLVTAYLFRSPVSGLIAVVPLIILVNALIGVGYRLLLDQSTYQTDMQSVSNQELALLIFGGLVVCLGSWGIHLLFARRRLTAPDRSGKVKELLDQPAPSAYRPPRFLTTLRPSKGQALIWQQFRQTGWPVCLLAGISFAMLVLDANSDRRFRSITEFLPLVIGLCACWIGGLAFYGDNVRRRVQFFADRGIRPTGIWLTRIVLPLSACLLLMLGCAFTSPRMFDVDTAAITIVMAFSFGQLVGQWVRRPMLTFLAGPAYVIIFSIVLMLFLDAYSRYQLFTLLVMPVLLFASWRLTSRWVNQQVGIGFHWRVLAYSALAIAIPMLCVISIRVGTTPSLDMAWRQQMALKVPVSDGTTALSVSPLAFSPIGTSSEFESIPDDELLDRLDKELKSTSIGNHVALDEIKQIVGDDSEVSLKSIEVLLKWSTEIREACIRGETSFVTLVSGAEFSESLAVSQLDTLMVISPSKRVFELIQQIPDSTLRRDSRRAAMILEWDRYQRTNWFDSTGYLTPKFFMSDRVADRVRHFGYERTRADRMVDETTKLILSQIDNLPMATSREFIERNALYFQVVGPQYGYRYVRSMRTCTNWTRDYEMTIDRLRSRVPPGFADE